MTTPWHDITLYDEIAILRLTRPPVNQLDSVFLEELEDAVSDLDARSDWRALIVTGNERLFCAGVDLKALPDLNVDQQDRLVTALNRLYTRLFGLSRPTVAAIDGHAIAGGFILALCCDRRIATDTPAVFGLTEVRVGVAFPVSALEIARAELEAAAFRRVVMFGDTFAQDEAIAMGAIDEIVDGGQLMDHAIDCARGLSEIPPGGYATVKRQVRAPALALMRGALDEASEPQLGGWVSEEAREAALKVLSGSG